MKRTSRSSRLDSASQGTPLRVARVDFGRFDGSSLERTPQGGLRIPANLTRVGVFTYRNPDGTTRAELRPADEVFKADALASLDDAPITDLHPTSMVSTENHASLAKGHVREVKKDGKFVAATLVVQDAAAVKAIESGARREISCGYTCREDNTPGTFEGQHYDLIQRDIRYNHAAIGPKGWGRAGSEVAMRIDSADASIQAREGNDGPEPTQGSDPMFKIKHDGVEYSFATQAEYDAFRALVASHGAEKARADGLQVKLTTETKRADTAEGQRDEFKTKLDTAVLTPAKIDELVTARVSLVTTAGKVLGPETKLDGKTDREIKELVVLHANPKATLTGKSDDYVNARFDAVSEAEPSPFEQSRVDLVGALHTDGNDRGAPPARPVPQWMQPHGVQK